MSEQYADLGITQAQDGDYWDVIIPDLDFATDYALQAGWIYTDKTKGTSELSDRFNFTTPEQEGLLAPRFISTDIYGENSILYISWNGQDSGGDYYLESILKQVNIWIKGGDFGDEYVRFGTFGDKAGTVTVNATKKSTYCVKLQAESKNGDFSPFSPEFCLILLEQPDPVFSVRHEWVKRDLVLFWKFDVTLPKNSLSDSFAVQLIADGKDITLYTNVDSTKIPPLEHKIVFTEARLAAIFGQVTAFQTDYDAFIYVRDTNLQTSTVVGYDVSAYVDPLTAPVISVTKGSMSYNVSFTNNSEFDKIYIEDSTNSGVAWLDQGSYTSNPVYVPTTNSLTRQVRARFSRVRGGYTGYSDIVSVTPDKIDQTDETPPDSIVNPTAEWSGSNLVVSFAMPAQNVPTDVEIYLTYSGSTKRFEKLIPTSTPSANTSVTIFKTEITDAWGADPLSFSAGYVTALDFYRNKNTTQVNISNISSAVKSNALSGQITTISVSGSANGYVVSSNFHAAATGISVYQSSSESGTYTLVASSNSSPVVVYDEANAGNTAWVKAQWTSSTGIASMSTASSVQILDVGSLSLIENPVKISTDGSIFAGTLDANNNPILSQARMVINKRGLFLYDDNDLNGTSPTTQIIGKWDATNTNAPATFITQKAKIGNWIVSSDKFENVLTAGTNIYTGISPNGTYAFWAGAGVAGGYSTDITKDAKFSVTASGNVIARNIKILGGEMQVGSKFTVNTDGKVSATDVVLTGEIIAEKGTIKGNLNIKQAGSLIARPLDSAPTSLNRVDLSYLGLFAYDASGIETTQISSNATSGGITFTTDAAKIGGWVVSPTTISSTGITLTSGSTPGSTSIVAGNAGGYVGIKPKGTAGSDIVLWAGTTQSPAANSASSGQAGFQVNADGQLYATGAIISGKIIVQSGSSLGGLLDETSKVYYSATTPTVPSGGHKAGDSWVDTANSNQLKIWSGTAWVVAQDSEAVKTIVNTKTKTTYGPTQPATAIAGDVWFDTTAGINYFKVYNGTQWVRMKDSDITAAAQAAADALTESNKKSTTTSSQTAPTAPKAGDIWFDTNFNYFKVWSTTVTPAAWVRLKDGDLTAAETAIQTANQNASNALSKAALFGVDGSLVSNMVIENSGAAIYSRYNSGGLIAKSSYSSTNAGFYLGWDLQGTVLYPAFNIGNANAYMKWSNYDQTLRIKGNISLNAGSDIDGATVAEVKAGAVAGSNALQPGGDFTGTIAGTPVATIKSGAAAGSNALQPDGNLTGTVGGTPVATIKSGATAGSTAAQPGNGVTFKNDGSKQINQIDLLASGIKISSATTGTRVEMSNTGLYLYKGTSGTPTVALDAATGDAQFSGVINASGGTFSGNITASGTINGGTITGATINSGSAYISNGAIVGATITGGIIQTSSSSSDRRIVISSSLSDSILFKGAASDSITADGSVTVGFGPGILGGGGLFSGSFPSITISAPQVTTNGAATAYPAKISLSNTYGGGVLEVNATWTRLRGYLELLNGFAYGTQAVRMISAGVDAPTSDIGKEGSVYFQIG